MNSWPCACQKCLCHCAKSPAFSFFSFPAVASQGRIYHSEKWPHCSVVDADSVNTCYCGLCGIDQVLCLFWLFQWTSLVTLSSLPCTYFCTLELRVKGIEAGILFSGLWVLGRSNLCTSASVFSETHVGLFKLRASCSLLQIIYLLTCLSLKTILLSVFRERLLEYSHLWLTTLTSGQKWKERKLCSSIEPRSCWLRLCLLFLVSPLSLSSLSPLMSLFLLPSTMSLSFFFSSSSSSFRYRVWRIYTWMFSSFLMFGRFWNLWNKINEVKWNKWNETTLFQIVLNISVNHSCH